MSGINASRERTDIMRNFWIEEGRGAARSKLTLRCNRMVLPLRNRRGEERVVIRGKSLTGTLRMAIALMKAYRTNGTVASQDAIREFAFDWGTSLSILDTKYMPENWVAVYVNGHPVFNNAQQDEMDWIEHIASGGSVSEEMLNASQDLFRAHAAEVQIMHESQLSLVVTSLERSVKCSILERTVAHEEGTLSFALTRKKRGAMIQALELATNVVEAGTLYRQYIVLNAKDRDVEGQLLRDLRMILNDLKERVGELQRSISVTVNNNQIQFWPEEPQFHIA